MNAYRVIKGENANDVDSKASAQLAVWNERWERKQTLELARASKEAAQRVQFLGGAEAKKLTVENQAAMRALETILVHGCTESVLDWNSLKEQTSFKTPKPVMLPLLEFPTQPNREQYEPDITLLDKLIVGRKAAKIAGAESRFQHALSQWQSKVALIEETNAKTTAEYERHVEDWRGRKKEFLQSQEAQHAFIEVLAQAYLAGDAQAIEYLASEALSRSTFPESFPQGFDLSFDSTGKLLVIDYELPNLEALPKYREVKYVASKGELQYVPVMETWRKTTYDTLLYQMALLIIHRVLSVDKSAFIYSVVFNGWVRSIDPATGAEAHGCILSLQAGRDEFTCLDLARVDPKACFKALKGVGSSKLVELTPIRPIAKLNKTDIRFVDGYAVADLIDDRTNLAAMDWQDFENLIREIFEKEFHREGGEVKITRASRDGGVDAVAFGSRSPTRGQDRYSS